MIHVISMAALTIGRISQRYFRPPAPAAIRPFRERSTPQRRQPSPLNFFLALYVILPASVKARASSGQRRSRLTAVATRLLMPLFRSALPPAVLLQQRPPILQVTPRSSRNACRLEQGAVPTPSRRRASLSRPVAVKTVSWLQR